MVRRCRECGCTDHNACVHPGASLVCSWDEPDLCSACAVDAVPGWDHPAPYVQHWTVERLASLAGEAIT